MHSVPVVLRHPLQKKLVEKFILFPTWGFDCEDEAGTFTTPWLVLLWGETLRMELSVEGRGPLNPQGERYATPIHLGCTVRSAHKAALSNTILQFTLIGRRPQSTDPNSMLRGAKQLLQRRALFFGSLEYLSGVSFKGLH